MSKLKAFLLVILFGLLCLGAWAIVMDKELGTILLTAGFISIIVFSTVCSSPRWF